MTLSVSDSAPFRFIPSMRWYGPDDPVSLKDIAQAGCEQVVSALHQVPIGEIWSKSDIDLRKNQIEAAGMQWKVVESLPVHEDIKTRSGSYRKAIENYRVSLKNLASCGIEVVTYNFMPILDWMRTDVSYSLPNGARALRFDVQDYRIFDLYLLRRPGAEAEISKPELKSLEKKYRAMTEGQKKKLGNNIMMGLPGGNRSYTRKEVLQLLARYGSIGARHLKQHLYSFLAEVIPDAAALNIKMAIHPDDPPYPVLGLPRVMCSAKDIEALLDAVPSKANGLCMCTGSYGVLPDNDLISMIRRWGDRIYFFHLRNTKRTRQGNEFYEAGHLQGDTDMYAVVKEAIQVMQREGRSIPMRPDHGHQLLDDLNKSSNPGYSAIGRLKGLAELRGLELGINRSLNE